MDKSMKQWLLPDCHRSVSVPMLEQAPRVHTGNRAEGRDEEASEVVVYYTFNNWMCSVELMQRAYSIVLFITYSSSSRSNLSLIYATSFIFGMLFIFLPICVSQHHVPSYV